MAVVMTRMANAAIPPFEFSTLAAAIDSYWKEVSKLAVENKVQLDLIDGVLHEMARLATSFEESYTSCNGSIAAARAVYMSERALQLSAGLPGRPWYKHSLAAPGQYTGYGAKTLPGVREALELGKFEEAVSQSRELVSALERFNLALAEAVRLMKAG